MNTLQRSLNQPNNFNYEAEGVYFITICAHERQCLFGEMHGSEVQLNKIGQISQKCWLKIAEHFQNVILDRFVIMPNHLHGILSSSQNDHSLDAVVNWFKEEVIKKVDIQEAQTKLWTRNYQINFIRNDFELENIRDYITKNPLQWDLDAENLHREALI
jgi:putative transposase